MATYDAVPLTKSLTLVVPVYNESLRFGLYASQLGNFIVRCPAGSELIFVDDGSSDDTPGLIERLIADRCETPIRLLRRTHRGKGAAVAVGLISASSEMACFCDFDLATPLDELVRIVVAAEGIPILAIGSRGAASARIKRHQHRTREFLGRTYNRLVQLCLVPGIADTQCGAKAAPTDIWAQIVPACREEGFAWDVEVIAVARMMGVRVQEVGIEWGHQEGSRVNLLSDGARMLCAVPRIRRNVVSCARSRPNVPQERSGLFDDASDDSLHWWFRSKATFVSLLIRHYAPKDGWLVEIGSGPRGVGAMLGWAPNRTLALKDSVELARETSRRYAVIPVACHAARLPIAGSTASVVCLLDVVEHLPDPIPTIREAARMLTPEGKLVVSVSANSRLCGSADQVVGRARRYTRNALRSDLESAGCEVLWMSHVFSWLALPMWLRRRARPAQGRHGVGAPFIDALSMLLTRIEWSIVWHRTLPIGTSVLCVAVSADRPGSAAVKST
ncbi:MAG TPA: glycosyltransferase [Mycobacterium sp.]|nr:glycosyltransferase [Mycobacterium sp.]HTX94536.1 glycosyltransferase [Mycobacterium sp.]